MIYSHICSPLDPVSQNLEIRQATTKFEIDQLRSALNDEHYLKAVRPSGNTIWQGVYQTDSSLNDAFDYYRDHREKSVKIITTVRPVQE